MGRKKRYKTPILFKCHSIIHKLYVEAPPISYNQTHKFIIKERNNANDILREKKKPVKITLIGVNRQKRIRRRRRRKMKYKKKH